MTEYSQAAEPRPVSHWGLVDQLAAYLHRLGVCRPPEQDDGEGPPVFLNLMPDTPDEALVIFGLEVDHAASTSNPTATFGVAARGLPDDQTGPEDTMQQVFEALHDRTMFNLTAMQTVLVCERIVNDPPVPDDNRRWHRADTYRAVLAPPTIS